MASKPCCDAGAPVQLEYSEKGTTVQVEGTKVYVTGSSKRAVCIVHDIFGFDYKQVFQVADRLADAGFTVAVPDMFDGKPWSMSEFPPKDSGKFMAWISTAGDTDKVAGIVKQTKAWLEANRGVTQCGVAGFCWGSTPSLFLAGDASFKGSSCSHPAFFGKEVEYAEAAVNPVCILPAQGDPMEDAQAVLSKKPFADKCKFRRFDGMEHGFMAARGDWGQPEIAKQAGEGVACLAEFFDTCMPEA